MNEEAATLTVPESKARVEEAESGRVEDAWLKSAFLQACRREPSSHTPVWLMRQAGRFLPGYRDLRARVGFLELCKTPELAAEVTVMAVEQLGVDAAILFADILLPLEALGSGLEYARGEGPVIHRPVRSAAAIGQLVPVEEAMALLSYVPESARQARAALPRHIPLIGFAGAPFTVASYLVEGGASRHFEYTKAFMYREPEGWHALLGILSRLTVLYLNAQIAAGCQAVQLFDSWVGCLSEDDYREFVLPHSREVIVGLGAQVPVIHFGTGTAHLLELMRQAGGDVIGLDWRVRLDAAWARLGHDVAVQGNLDPVVLLAGKDQIRERAARILGQAGGRPGHIFNLGHGVLPTTPVANVKYLVEAVHELGIAGHG